MQDTDAEASIALESVSDGTVEVTLIDNDNDMDDKDEDGKESATTTETDQDDDNLEVDEDYSDNLVRRTRKSTRIKKTKAKTKTKNDNRRTSKRTTKFINSMTVDEDSDADMLMASSSSEDEVGTEEKHRKSRRQKAKDTSHTAGTSIRSDAANKSPARKHVQTRRQMRHFETKSDSDKQNVKSASKDNLEDDTIDDESDTNDKDEDDNLEPLRIQRILAARSETKAQWRKICSKINTSEIENGSRWFQEEEVTGSDNTLYQERFLIKWHDMSYLHCSWETQEDLVEQVEKAKMNLSVFFRKNVEGYIFTPDERCDGDYFDPSFTQVERILEVIGPQNKSDNSKERNYGMVMDRKDPKFESGTGRQFLVKWVNTPYGQSTYEFERDLLINDIEYETHLSDYEQRTKRVDINTLKKLTKENEDEVQTMYGVFGDESAVSESLRSTAVEKFKEDILKRVFKNGGTVRDYQAEGITWLVGNYINDRSSILADEMGLGKTLQTVATIDTIQKMFCQQGVFLVIAPLSTLIHWQREFQRWTDLNVVLYHGNAEDRQVIREVEFAHEAVRPPSFGKSRTHYLRRCKPKKNTIESPWMVQVVLTSPELLVAEDCMELAAIEWEVLIVDEAHRLKNSSSKLTTTLKDSRFTFQHKILLTGTPIQNDVQEFWTLLNFMEPSRFDNMVEFNQKYDKIQSKEVLDQLHGEIRPYILRRLKEDVEKSVPPKEETLIEVELTVEQKKYYRALYEKNVQFLHKDKRSIDGPSLSNLAMQLRKCCNHPFLLKGVEADLRAHRGNMNTDEGDFLTHASGKLVLLDKLLPRLKSQGHRVLLFSQFKIMLDILEDYLNARRFKFERIDGSITGNKRQQAIDRFQSPGSDDKEPPFVMMLSTRAGGVGINLTAADTCIIFDSDWNPQNDLQAQARCHRIGQTKDVKVYRLLTRKTYEIQMFHLSSLKMGLDQAVLKGLETGSSNDSTLSKEEIERLLKFGAYDIFNEDKAGKSEAESNEFIQQDIDSILERRSHVVVHDANRGTKQTSSSFSKASFKFQNTTSNTSSVGKVDEDIDINDPNFWEKMVGAAKIDENKDVYANKKRKRTRMNYSEDMMVENIDDNMIVDNDNDSDAENVSDSDDEDLLNVVDGDVSNGRVVHERSSWGGKAPQSWKKEHAELLLKRLYEFGYSKYTWDRVIKSFCHLQLYGEIEVRRMAWSMYFQALLEYVAYEVSKEVARKNKDDKAQSTEQKGGVLIASCVSGDGPGTVVDKEREKSIFETAIKRNMLCVSGAITDAIEFAKSNDPREQETIDKCQNKTKTLDKNTLFAANLWPTLKGRGWNAKLVTGVDTAGQTIYEYKNKEYKTIEEVVAVVPLNHPELSVIVKSVADALEEEKQRTDAFKAEERKAFLSMTPQSVSVDLLNRFLWQYGPLQLFANQSSRKAINARYKLLSHSMKMVKIALLNEKVISSGSREDKVKALAAFLSQETISSSPHPLWSHKDDAVLILSIADHGWIDCEGIYQLIASGNESHWSTPFLSAKNPANITASTAQDVAMPGCKEAAERACTILNKYGEDLFSKIKGFSAKSVVRLFSLQVAPGSDAHAVYCVDAKHGPMTLYSNINLPTKKEMQNRLKSLFEKIVIQDGTVSLPQVYTHGYTSLDNSLYSNLLLSQLLSAVLKAPIANGTLDLALKLSISEGSAQSYVLARYGKAEASQDVQKIVDHLQLVQRHFKINPVQAKNVVRAILGMPPVTPRHASDAVYPRTQQEVQTVKKISPSVKVTTHVKEDNTKSIAETAINAAVHRLSASGKDVSALMKDTSGLVHLTEIETLILLSVSVYGLPSTDLDKQGGVYCLSWKEFGRKVEHRVKNRLKYWVDSFTKLSSKNQITGSTSSVLAASNLKHCEHMCNRMSTVVAQAAEYTEEPQTLAIKTMVMINKLVKHAKLSTGNVYIDDETSSLGRRVMKWFDQRLRKVSELLSLIDENDDSMSYIAFDFLSDIDAESRDSVAFASSLDCKNCQVVVDQIATMTGIRHLFTTKTNQEISVLISTAATKLQPKAELSKSKLTMPPTWWYTVLTNLSGRHIVSYDHCLLLQTLIDGLEKTLILRKLRDTTSKSGILLFEEEVLTAAFIQQRIRVLIQELFPLMSSSVPTKDKMATT